MNRSHRLTQIAPVWGWRRLRAAGMLVALLLAAFPAIRGQDRKSGPPEFTFSFASLNIPGLSPNFLGVGASMFTLHFVDGDHLLLTYGLRELVPRLVGDSPDDSDRLVGAELVELPSGKILAKTRWHLHDHGRYLWNLTGGRFLLREGDDLYAFAPMANLASDAAFQRLSVPHRSGVLDAVIVSPDGKLLTLESHKPEKKKLTGIDINVLTNGDLPVHPAVTYDFFRLSGTGAPASPLRLARVGSVEAANALRLPVDGDGYLIASGGKRGRWNVDFESFTGNKPTLVGVVESNCNPGLELVSATQYLAFTCRSANSDNLTIAAYDFAKNDIWEEPMGSFTANAPAFAFAPSAGRFAISRRMDTPAPGIAAAPSGDITTQEIRVYGTQTGDLLAKTYGVPVFRTSENFDLSPDGMRFAVVRNSSIEVFRLPELTKGDREDLAVLAKLAPPPASGPINLRRMTRDVSTDVRDSDAAADAAQIPAEDRPSAAGAAAAPVAPAPPSVPPALAEDSAGPMAAPSADLPVRRKPPTLLNPGEKAEIGKSKSEKKAEHE